MIHVSQIGYHPGQEKVAIIELDKNETENRRVPVLDQLAKMVDKYSTFRSNQTESGDTFLRYNYLKFDFSSVNRGGNILC